MQVVSLVLFVPLNKAFNYLDELNCEVGDIVSVSFGNREALGVVVKTNCEQSSNLKPVKKIHHKKVLSSQIIDFYLKVSSYNCINIGTMFKNVLTPLISLKEAKKEYVFVENKINFNLKELSPEQSNILNSIELNKFSTNLIHGTTGSGKTEIYFHLIAKAIEKGMQSLFLLPEIALTNQIISRFERQFGFTPLVWNSSITPAKKRNIWKEVTFGNSPLLIGTRSSAFLPFKKLGLIIIDEEHDSSFKQSESPCYNARDMSILRGYMYNIPVILGSATPSIESLHNCNINKFKLYKLQSRFGSAKMPTISIVDLKKEKLSRGKYISSSMENAMRENLDKGNQTIIFLNKRGYAPTILCKECGQKLLCPDCQYPLTHHRSKNQFICHCCNYSSPIAEDCKHCGKEKSIIFFGVGVEKLEEEIKLKLPKARISIITSDTVDNSKKLNEALRQIEDNEVDIIIGTQILAKGHDFPSITLVGIVDGESGLSGGDIRSTERVYQLLTQVSGRAGRGEFAGKVIIQTYNEKNIILKSVIDNNFESLLKFEMENRKRAKLPPFGKLALISVSGREEMNTLNYAKFIVKVLHKYLDAYSKTHSECFFEILGAIPHSVYKIKQLYRYKILIKYSNVKISDIISIALSEIKKISGIRVKIDIDPYLIG